MPVGVDIVLLDRCSAFVSLCQQVVDGESIQRAVSSAWPRQALALTMAHWELATKSTSLLGSLPAVLEQTPVTPAASSLLMLASLTSKAACVVQQPLPDQAMDTWQHATWPTGDTELLCMSLVLAADQHLQSFADRFGKDQGLTPDHRAGKLQQAVSAAVMLLTQLAVCVSDALGAVTEADDEKDDEGQRPTQSEGLHPAVVGAMATRVYQLSNGEPQAAMALLVASVLPEWELDFPEAGQAGNGPAQPGPQHLVNGELTGGAGERTPLALSKRARSYRKRARSPSRSVTSFVFGCSKHELGLVLFQLQIALM